MDKIKHRKYRLYKTLLVIFLTVAIVTLVSFGNYTIPLILFVIAIALEFLLRKRIDAQMTDERLNLIAGKASRIVLVSFTLLLAAAGIVLISLRNLSPYCLVIGNILIGIECSMMLLYAVLFRYYSSRKI
jgi:uncharacterized membrane protein